MAKDPEGLKAWEQARGEWHKAHMAGREARFLVTQALIRASGGHELAPERALLEEVDRLEEVADRLSEELDRLVRSRMA